MSGMDSRTIRLDDDGAVKTAIDLHWIPLGAGGHSVRFNGIVYESLAASIQRRPRYNIYHSALELTLPDGVYTVEMTPVPNSRGWERGLIAEGPLGSSGRDDFGSSVTRSAGGRTVSSQTWAMPCHRHCISPTARVVERAFGLLPAVPALTWGRDESRRGYVEL